MTELEVCRFEITTPNCRGCGWRKRWGRSCGGYTPHVCGEFVVDGECQYHGEIGYDGYPISETHIQVRDTHKAFLKFLGEILVLEILDENVLVDQKTRTALAVVEAQIAHYSPRKDWTYPLPLYPKQTMSLYPPGLFQLPNLEDWNRFATKWNTEHNG